MGTSAPELDPDKIRTKAEFATALRAARARAGLSVRDLARRLGAPSGTLGDYFSGRHLPSSSQTGLMRALLAECGLDEEDIARWLEALNRVRTAPAVRLEAPAPYKGLTQFTEMDADVFFGREVETAALLELIRSVRAAATSTGALPIVTVVAPSGAGKSSLLRAGLAARILAGALNRRGETWSCVTLTPSDAAADGLTPLIVGTPTPRVVVIDQIEELFTTEPNGTARAGFLETLMTQPPDHTIVVFGLRADYYAAALGESALVSSLTSAQFVLTPMGNAQLREVIVEPARRRGATVEPGLVDVLLAEMTPGAASSVRDEPGLLPLLSHVLLSTWRQGDSPQLGLDDYRRTGGIAGAVQQTAEQAFLALDDDHREAARRLFLRLVHVDDEVAFSRRRVPQSELTTIDGADARLIGPVLDSFVRLRLLTADTDAVQLSHEALTSAWPRLRVWLEADRVGQRIHRQVTEAANTWNAHGRREDLLLRGVTLDVALEWSGAEGSGAGLNVTERDFLAASEVARRRAQQRDRRRTRRLRRLLGVVAALAVLAVVLAALAFQASRRADRDRAAATGARENALSRQIAVQAEQLQTANPALAQQLAIVAYRAAHTAAARSALTDLSARAPITRILGAPGPTPLALAPDGRIAAIGRATNGSVHLYRLGPAQIPQAAAVLPGPRDHRQVFAIAFSPNSRLLAVGGFSPVVQLWDLRNVAHPRPLPSIDARTIGAVQSLGFDTAGRRLAVAGSGKHPIELWSVANGTRRELPPPRGSIPNSTVHSVAFSTDGRLLAAGATGGSIMVWPSDSPASTAPRRATAGGTVNAVAFARDDHTLYVGDETGAISSANIADRRLHLYARDHLQGPVAALAVSPDGRQVAAGDSNDSIDQFSTQDWSVQQHTACPGPITGLGYLPNARTLFSAAADGAMRSWPTTSPAIPTPGNVFAIDFDRNGNRVLIAYNGAHGATRVWDVKKPDDPRALGPPLGFSAGHASADGTGAISRNGDLVAEGNSKGQLTLWNVTNLATPLRIGRVFGASADLIEGLTFSPDGRYLASASDDGTVRLWDISNPTRPTLTATLHGGSLMLSVAFSPNGRLLAGANANDLAYLWSIADPHHPHRLARLGGFRSYVYGVAFSPDGSLLAATSSDHTTRLWDIRHPTRPVRRGPPLLGPTDYVYSASFQPGGHALAVSSNDHSVWVYNDQHPSHPTAMATLRGVTGNVFATAFSPSGKYLLAGGRSSDVPVWTWNPDTYAREVCRAAGTPITRAEWRLYVPGKKYAPPCR